MLKAEDHRNTCREEADSEKRTHGVASRAPSALLILVVFTACTFYRPLSEREAAFATALPVKEVNTRIGLSLSGENDQPRLGEMILLLLENRSDNTIVFPKDYGVIILVFDETRRAWTTVRNNASYSPESDLYLYPEGQGPFHVADVGLKPDLPDRGVPISIRVVVMGRVFKDSVSTGEEVGAYIDLTLKPLVEP